MEPIVVFRCYSVLMQVSPLLCLLAASMVLRAQITVPNPHG
jgi:hypothetical protein